MGRIEKPQMERAGRPSTVRPGRTMEVGVMEDTFPQQIPNKNLPYFLTFNRGIL